MIDSNDIRKGGSKYFRLAAALGTLDVLWPSHGGAQYKKFSITIWLCPSRLHMHMHAFQSASSFRRWDRIV